MSDEVAIRNRRYANPRHNERIVAESWSGFWQAVADGVPRGRALDLGCGLGCDTEHLLALGFSVTLLNAENEAAAPAGSSSGALVTVGGVRKQFFQQEKIPVLLRDRFELLRVEVTARKARVAGCA